MILEFVRTLTEAMEARTPHPEDAIFNGSAAAAAAVTGLGSVIANPQNLTIKWDGFPALIFGRNPDGKLVVVDKYMFDKQVMATSPEDWQRYDASKQSGRLRGDLYAKLAVLWPGLDAAVKGPGYFWGDLLWAGQLKPIKGKYVFQPNTVEYKVPVNSNIGEIIKGKSGGIVVHQHFAEFGGSPTAWNGKGLANVNGGVAIITPSLGIRFNLKEPVQASRAAASALKKYGAEVDALLATLPGSTKEAIKRYFNQKITAQTNLDLHVWMKTNVSAKQYNALVGDDFTGSMFTKDASGQVQESPGYAGLKAIWNAIYAYKVSLAQQLEQQVQGIEQYINGQPGGEGFVFPTPTGLVKIVNRGQFGVAHFNK